MRGVWSCLFGGFAGALLGPASARGAAPAPGRAITVRLARTVPAETLAVQYYGTRSVARAILLANGIPAWGRRLPRLIRGRRVILPTAWGYRVRPGDRWAELGRRYLGHARRGAFLAWLNGKAAGRPPPAGHVLLIPALVLIRPPPGMGWMALAARLLGLPGRDPAVRRLAERIQRFQGVRGVPVPRGRVLVPLAAMRLLAWYLPNPAPDEGHRASQQAEAAVRRARTLLRRGDFLGALAATAGAVGWGRAAAALRVERWLIRCTAFVAFGRPDLALSAAKEALRLNPRLVLDANSVSPKVRAVFRRAAARGTGRRHSPR